MTVDIEFICIGNELLIGKVANTNAHWLALQATALGAKVRKISVIQDTVEDIVSCLHEVSARKPGFIVTTGGLGPTFDDKTFQGIAKALNQPLKMNPEAFEMVRNRCSEYAKKSGHLGEVEMTPPRIKMALFPENTLPITNPIGTAPALRAQIGSSVLFALPGVPLEMMSIFTQTIAPLIKQVVGSYVFCERSLFVEGVAEAQLAPLIDRVMNDNLGVYVKSHPLPSRSDHTARIELHLTATVLQEKKPAQMLQKAINHLTRLIEENREIVPT
ncbi:MAG: competence damage-inducible protein A [Nitrososphaerota archaeon]|nr:competence damage-inducible protein A [Nitrososphaerota archaeon]